MDEEFGRIDRELIEARAEFQKARELVSSAAQLIHDLDDPLNPDGLTAAKMSQKRLEQAWERYQTAIAAYGRYRPRR